MRDLLTGGLYVCYARVVVSRSGRGFVNVVLYREAPDPTAPCHPWSRTTSMRASGDVTMRVVSRLTV